MPSGLNRLQTEIYKVAAKTLRLCAHEHYEDCPWREQALYAMDSRNQMLFGYGAFGETALPKESLRLLAQGQKPYGLLELCAPAMLPDKINIPSFSLIWVCALEEYYRQTQDLPFVREMLPVAERIFAFFKSYLGEDGLVGMPVGYWNFYEWAPMLDGGGTSEEKEARAKGADAPLNAFYLMALRAYRVLLKAVGEHVRALDADQRIAKTALAYHNAFYSPTHRAYRLSTVGEWREQYPELVQALSVVADVCPNVGMRRGLVLRLADGAFLPRVTLSHRVYYYDALLTEPDLRERVLADVEEHWLPMLCAGATAFWETELGEADFDRAGSLCHGWSAAPIYVYWKCFGV